ACAGGGRLQEVCSEAGTTEPSWIYLSSLVYISWIIRRRYPNIYFTPWILTLSGQHVEVAKMLRSRNSASKIRRNRQPLLGLALVCAGSVVFVSCSTVLSEMPTQVGGLPAGTPQRPAAAPEYPAVHEM